MVTVSASSPKDVMMIVLAVSGSSGIVVQSAEPFSLASNMYSIIGTPPVSSTFHFNPIYEVVVINTSFSRIGLLG